MDVPEPQAKSWTIGAKNKGKRNLRFFFFFSYKANKAYT